MRYQRLMLVAAGAFAGWLAPAGALAQQDTGQPSSDTGPSSARGALPGASASQLITASATVDKVNADKRELVLKGDKGKPFTVQVPEKVSRLENVKAGDTVTIAFYQSVGVSFLKPGQATPGEQTRSATERMGGNLPGGVTGDQITTIAKVTKVDKTDNEVTIQSPTGDSNTIKISDPQVQSQLQNVKVGDKIRATYTTAMATSVTPKKQM